MPEPRLHFDRSLQLQQVLDLSGADAVAGFFAHLGYPVDQRIEQAPANLDITAESTLKPIRRIELLASVANEFQVYLFEVASVTITHRKALVRAFRNRSGHFLLVVTSDYERLDFVLVETYEPPEVPGKVSPFHATLQKVRPRAHTVERRKPTEVDLRVLRRFTWTEDDGFAQYSKLRAAFDLATWSEREFNNRALFSDHYLKTRLQDFPDWHEDPKPAYRELNTLYRNARGRFGREDLESLRQEILDPTLTALGFSLGEPSKNADLLGRPLLGAGGDTSLGWCLDFPWGRSLDAKDPRRDRQTPEINPSVVVVDLLEHEDVGVPWIILTNGQIWRLYGRQAHSRATNYYEIDVEEVVSATSPLAAAPQEPFRYFWLLFRRRAFEPRSFRREGREVSEPLLTHLWVESGEYAKKLGERLKDKIFEEVFETLARGFLESRDSDGSPTQEELTEAFEGTLTFLYRLLFLLYAEARDLLPVREVRGYHQASLSRLKGEVAAAAGPALSQADERLEEAYGDEEVYDLYHRLLRLFEIVDRGDPKLNVPMYNGGLFLTDPDEEDHRPEADAARFLRTHKVADQPLARALDRLARDEDEKTSALVPIDYKSLGVRQLGSIYEGLLEFRLRVATEPMAIVKGKKTEEVIPLAEARKKGRKILRQGRGKDAPERLVAAGEIYLENDKRERRATGSYYTPDFVVEYIVRKAVGPVLREKLEALRPQLREAEHWHRKRTREAPEKGESPTKYESGQAVETTWRQLIDDAFDIKIVDPAMGSGHFLVEAVDFVTDEILRFLRSFPWNPIFAHLEYLRVTILRQMEAQDITIDADRLTDTHLLKRHVLKRCIFGVDINPMAVELAKVSLWLDCFTLGAPLSFLDHHLRCGNSLLGATIREVDELRAEKGQLTLAATSDWQGLVAAVRGMIAVGGMPDATPDQVVDSMSLFNDALSNLRPFKRILDIYTARLFRDDPTILDQALRSGELFAWAHCDQALVLDTEPFEPLLTEAISTVQGRRAFHWELEFPEVFHALNQETGFDAIIGNPPYVRVQALRQSDPRLVDYLKSRYKSAKKNFDIYLPFFERSLLLTNHEVCFIASNKWFSTDYGEGLRKMVGKRKSLHRVVDFKDHQLFEAATNYPAIVGLTRQPNRTFEYTDASTGEIHRPQSLPIEEILKQSKSWWFGKLNSMRLRRRLLNSPMTVLAEVVDRNFQGLRTSDNSIYVLLGDGPANSGELSLTSTATGRRHRIEAEIVKPLLSGDDIRAFSLTHNSQWILFPYRIYNGKARPYSELELQKSFPGAWDYLKRCEDRLRNREKGRMNGPKWWRYIYPKNLDQFEQNKVMLPDYHDSPAAAIDEKGEYYCVSGYCLTLKSPALLGLHELAALLNSDVLFWLLSTVGTSLRGAAVRFMPQYLAQLPIPHLSPEERSLLRDIAVRGAELGFPAVRDELNELVNRLYELTREEQQILSE